MNIIIRQDKANYYSTGDYFHHVMVKEGIKQDLNQIPDLVINFIKTDEADRKEYVYYERDTYRGLIFKNVPKERTFYTQYTNEWNDSQVITHGIEPGLHERSKPYNQKVVFVGKLYPDRDIFIKKLSSFGVDVIVHGDHHPPKEYVDLLNQGSIILNRSNGKEINRRVFEGMAIGCLVTDRVFGLDNIAEENKHYFGFDRDKPEEAAEVINKLINDQNLIKTTHEKSRKLMLAKHTYKHKFYKLLKKVGL